MCSPSRKKLVLSSVSVSLGCSSCRSRRPRLSQLFHAKPKPRPKNKPTWEEDGVTSSTCSPCVRGLGRIGGEGVAVEKDSDDPYFDFRESMLQMILENQIYSKDDLTQLLTCFLHLNSPYHHGVILRAFTEICNDLLSPTFHLPSHPLSC